MDEAIKSIKAQLYDRVTSPLSGAFVFSWIAWNYQFVITIFSSMDPHEKFEYISIFLYPGYSCLLQGFLWPVITTLVYIFLYPFPAKWVYIFAKTRQKVLKIERVRIEDETPLSKEEYKKIRREIVELELENDKAISRKDDEIQRLKGYIEDLKSQSSKNNPLKSINLPNTPSIFPFAMSKEEHLILKVIAEHELCIEDDLHEYLNIGTLKLKHYLHEAESNGVIASEFRAGATRYKITPEGLKILFDEGMIDEG